ncbi:hypothetical protein [Cereibacter sphaeroides]|uniref:hypothetical protein n=1 Tax=Cereibacter sphaeroides TaxID=1063 RepID=UPI001194E193|nr:hypothetical protein [Cereibacter sphaeroides]GEM94294.1 hypothetical protein RSP03_33610 [Cereibacter sphaeroides]
MAQTVPGSLHGAFDIASHQDIGVGAGRAQTLFALLALAISFTSIDLAATWIFADGTTFGLAGHQVLTGLRQIGLKGPFIILGGHAAASGAACGSRAKPDPRARHSPVRWSTSEPSF